jgi:hypothetical protein
MSKLDPTGLHPCVVGEKGSRRVEDMCHDLLTIRRRGGSSNHVSRSSCQQVNLESCLSYECTVLCGKPINTLTSNASTPKNAAI